jgi:hypothetical protein
MVTMPTLIIPRVYRVLVDSIFTKLEMVRLLVSSSFSDFTQCFAVTTITQLPYFQLSTGSSDYVYAVYTAPDSYPIFLEVYPLIIVIKC